MVMVAQTTHQYSGTTRCNEVGCGGGMHDAAVAGSAAAVTGRASASHEVYVAMLGGAQS